MRWSKNSNGGPGFMATLQNSQSNVTSLLPASMHPSTSNSKSKRASFKRWKSKPKTSSSFPNLRISCPTPSKICTGSGTGRKILNKPSRASPKTQPPTAPGSPDGSWHRFSTVYLLDLRLRTFLRILHVFSRNTKTSNPRYYYCPSFLKQIHVESTRGPKLFKDLVPEVSRCARNECRSNIWFRELHLSIKQSSPMKRAPTQRLKTTDFAAQT